MTTLTAEQTRIRSYLQAQGAKLPPAELIAKVQGAMRELYQAVAAVPAARFFDRPEPGEWSANEVMAHVVSTGAYFSARITQMIAGDSSPLHMTDLARTGAPGRTLEAWWADLEQDRSALFAGVARADPDAHLDLTVEHRMFGPLNWREALLFLRLHDLDHAGQLNKITAAFS